MLADYYIIHNVGWLLIFLLKVYVWKKSMQECRGIEYNGGRVNSRGARSILYDWINTEDLDVYCTVIWLSSTSTVLLVCILNAMISVLLSTSQLAIAICPFPI